MKHKARSIVVVCAAAAAVSTVLGPAAAAPRPLTAEVTHSGLPHAVQTAVPAPGGSVRFGDQIAMDTDTIAVASETGVTLYPRTASGIGPGFTLPVPADAVASDSFGSAIAIDGNLLVVSADDETEDSKSYAGAAYVYQRLATGWSAVTAPVAVLTSPAPSAGGYFGYSVAVQGTEVLVGAARDDSGLGAAYLFFEPLTGWEGSAPGYVTLGGLGEDSAVGTSVAIDGDDMLVGAPYYSEDSKGEGAVFVYAAGPTGWTNEIPTRILYDASAGSVQDIGNSIAFDGRYVAAAGPGDSDLGAGGEVDLFEQPVGGWAGTGDLAPAATISDSANNSGFGDSVAIQAGVLLVGQSVRAHGLNDAGAVDVYVEPAAGWATTSIPAERFTSNPAQTDSGFGTALAMVGNQIAVGADGLVGAGTADDPTGSAYVYTTYPLPKLTSVKESHSTWKRSAKLPSLDPKKAVKGGTAFHFTTNQAMPVTLSFAKRGKHGKYGASHKLKESAKSGKNVVYFDGRLTKKTKLSAGRFRVVIQAKNVAGDSTTTHTLHFTIKT